MSQTPSKRRKLAHDNSDISASSHAGSEDELAEDAAEGEPNAATTTAKQALPKRTRDDDGSALYAGGLYKSNMFKLQVEEMLAEIRPNYEKRFNGANAALRKLKGVIEAIDDKAPLPIADATKALQKTHKITIPFPNPKPDKNAAYKVSYTRPNIINVVGSYPLKHMLKANDEPTIDMVIVMPHSIFQEKDFLNYRYFYKRSYYLACLAAGIQEAADDEFSLSFDNFNGNSLHSILVIKPKQARSKTSQTNYKINIIPAAPENLFSETKLRPAKNAIRPKDTEDEAARSPTPFYNASIRSDSNYEAYLKLIHTTSRLSAGFSDACLLGRIWLHQRGFGSGISQGGFGHFEWATVTALLLKGGERKGHSLLSPAYSSYQMFKAVVQYLSTSDLACNPYVHANPDIALLRSGAPVFYDGPREQNILYKMTPWSYKLLRDEAKTSLDMLNDSTFDHFESSFILRTCQPLQRYDCIMRVPKPVTPPDSIVCDHLSDTAILSSRLFEILSEGLSDRVKLINIHEQKHAAWSIKSSTPSGTAGPLSVSFVFDPANIDRLVDHGPPAEEKKKAAKFREFWGEKAELRRFKDGSILETLVWKPGSTYSILKDIVTHLVRRHCGQVNDGLTFIGESFANALPPSTTSSAPFAALKEAFKMFEMTVRNLEGLPLQLRQLSAISPHLRYSSVNLPSFSPQRPLKTPADVLVQFEGSGRWPDDIVAIQRTKIALLLKIGSQLQESDDRITTRLGLENEDQRLQNCAFLDVVYESGAVFRLRIHNDREQTLLDRIVKNKSGDSRVREDAVSALSTYKTMFIQLPLLHQSISTYCTRYPLLSPTIRLVKLWFDRHMLSGHIREELVELIVAGVFLRPYPWSAPSSVMTGFLRALMFISKWDWRVVPLIVDFTGNMGVADVLSINTRLEAWRNIDPAMNRTILFAASNHDTTGVAFADKSPSKVVAARMTALAVSAYKLVKEQGIKLDQRSMFASSVADYDFVIHISPAFTEKAESFKKQKFKNLEVQSDAKLDVIAYDYVQMYVCDIQRLFASSIVFFNSTSSSSIIAGVWKPQTTTPGSFKVNIAHASKVMSNDEEKEQTVLDKDATLLEIARLGADMVSRIDVRR